MIEQLIAARSRFKDMNRGINPLFHQSPIQVQLHVTRSLEFLKNDFIHSALRVHQGSRQDCQAASFLAIPGGPEKALWFKQSLRFNATGHDAPFTWLECVITACQPGDTVQKDDDIFLEFDETLCAFAYQLRHLDMARRVFIKGGAENFTIEALPKVRHLFRAFVYQ